MVTMKEEQRTSRPRCLAQDKANLKLHIKGRSPCGVPKHAMHLIKPLGLLAETCRDSFLHGNSDVMKEMVLERW